MRKVLLLLAIAVSLTSCSSDDAENANESQQEQTSNYYKGVYVSKQDKMLFASFYDNGNISYCLDKNTMGYGSYIINGNKIAITNEYTGNTDNLSISKSDGVVMLTGHVQRLGATEWSYINISLTKTDESQISSLSDEEWWMGHFNSVNGTLSVYYIFTSSHEAIIERWIAAVAYLMDKKKMHYTPRKLKDMDENGLIREREIIYYHLDTNKSTEIYVSDKEGSKDLIYW